MANNYRIRGNEQEIYLGTGKLVQVQDLSINSNFGTAPLNYIGRGKRNVNLIPNSEQNAELSINSSLINNDPFISLTGSNPINLFILKSQNDITNNYCLISGYLTSYNASFSVGQIPQISTTLKFYNNAGKIPVLSLDSEPLNQLQTIQTNNYSNLNDNYLIPNFGSLVVTLNEIENNRVLNFDINIDINRIPIYNLGSKYPKRVDIISPINTNCSFTLEMSNYDPTILRDFPQNKQIQDITLSVNDFNNGQNITTYNLRSMTLTNEVYGTSIDGNVTITKQFVGTLDNDSAEDLSFYRITEDEDYRITEDGYRRILN